MSLAQVLDRPPIKLRLGELPVLPAVVLRLMSLSPQSEELFEEVLAVAQEDPGFALRVMHIANSAMSSPASRIETLERAVARLGAAHVADLVTTVAMTRVFVPRTPAEKDLWRHAVEVATACRAIIRRHPVNGVSAEQGYLAGLLHDIGHFIMIAQAPWSVQAVEALGSTTPAELIEAEREVCGTDHTELGAQVCAYWSVPERIVFVVKDHHRSIADVPSPLLAALKQADWLSVWRHSHVGGNNPVEALQLAIPDGEMAAVPDAPRLTAAELVRLLPEVSEASTRTVAALGLATH
ncbi:MAG: HDOD domain-containing protein [Acidimicrobiales bacterium]